MTEAAPGEDAIRRTRHPAVVLALSIPFGLVATWWWIGYSPHLTQSITFSSDVQAVIVFYIVLFGPLIALAAVLGLACGIRVFRLGKSPLLFLAAGLAAGALGLATGVLFAWLNGGVVPTGGPAALPSMVLLGLALTLFQSSAEEFLMRGWLQEVIGRLTTPLAGVGLAALLFAGLHLASGPVAPHSLVNMVLAGCFFGLLALRSGGLVAPCAAHFAWNAAEDVGFGLVPNPGLGPFGAIRDLDIRGAELWGGGMEGLNASIGTTIVLVALILPLLVRSRPRAEPALAV